MRSTFVTDRKPICDNEGKSLNQPESQSIECLRSSAVHYNSSHHQQSIGFRYCADCGASPIQRSLVQLSGAVPNQAPDFTKKAKNIIWRANQKQTMNCPSTVHCQNLFWKVTANRSVEKMNYGLLAKFRWTRDIWWAFLVRSTCTPINYGNILFLVNRKMDEIRNKDGKTDCYRSDNIFLRYNSFCDIGFTDSNVNIGTTQNQSTGPYRKSWGIE